MKCYPLIALLFLSSFVTMANATWYIIPDVYVSPGTVHFGDEWISTTNTLLLTAWFEDNWTNYTVTNSGTQEIYNGSKPGLVYIDGASHLEGSGWSYTDGITTVTEATGSASLYYGAETGKSDVYILQEVLGLLVTPFRGMSQTLTLVVLIRELSTGVSNAQVVPISPTVPSTVDFFLGADVSMLLQYLTAGDLLGFIVACYTTRLGQLFYAILALLVTILLALRTQSIIYPAIVWLFLGGLFQLAAPVISPAAVLLIILGVGALFYKLFTRE